MNLWLGNEEDTYRHVCDLVRAADKKARESTDRPPCWSQIEARRFWAQESIKDFAEELTVQGAPGGTMASDLATGALWAVEWDHLTEAWIESMYFEPFDSDPLADPE